jgi:phage terminase large subunit-like protein
MTPHERFEQLKKKYHYDPAAAEEKIRFIETHCRHVEGDLYGQPLILPETFKSEIIRPIFGLKRPNGKRLIRTVYVQMPRKNAKSTMMASIQLSLLYNDGEPSAQIYNCAGNDEQAGLLFTICSKMVALDETLRKASKSFRSSIVYNGSFIKKITSKSGTKHGFNSHACTYDEVHVAQNSELYDTLKTSFGQRSNPLMLAISTPGHDKLSLCYRLYEYACKILSGLIEDDSFWTVIYESPGAADIYSEQTWRLANPLYDHSENLRETIAIEANEVKNDVSKENVFRRLRLGQWTSSEVKWVKSELWTALKGNVSRGEYDGEPVWIGLDRSSTQDLSSACYLFEDGDFLIPFWELWIPQVAAEDAERRFGIPYSQWAKEGWITIVEGNTIGSREVRRSVVGTSERNPIVILAYDEWNTRDLAVEFEDDYGIQTIIEPQGFRLSSGIKKIKELILNAKFHHNGNPVVAWALDNVMVKENDELNIKIVKPKDYKKIDPWISLAMAVKNWMTERPRRSVYSDRGVISID